MRHHHFATKRSLSDLLESFKRVLTRKAVDYALLRSDYKLLSSIIAFSAVSKHPVNPQTLPIIWVLGKEGLDQDFQETISDVPWCCPKNIFRGLPKQLAHTRLPYWVDDNTYAATPDYINKSKLEYREIWSKIFFHMEARNKPDAIITGNFGYFAERELSAAADAHGIPFIAMHKECLKSPGRVVFFNRLYQNRGKFQGRKIIVYNEIERKLQIDSGVATPDQIEVSGMPRLDQIHRFRANNPTILNERPTLLAMGFTPDTGLPRIPRKTKDGQATFEYVSAEHKSMKWSDFFHGYLTVLSKIAIDNPNWNVFLKLKSRLRDAEPSIDFFEKNGTPGNLKIVVGGDPSDLIKQSNVICGFNTTSVLEGIAAGIPAVTPSFDEAESQTMRDYAVDFGNGVIKPTDPDSMYNTICSLMKKPSLRMIELSSEHKQTLDKWVGNPDGHSSARFSHIVKSEISSKR